MGYSRGTAQGDLLVVVGLLILLGIAWFILGGPENSRARSGPFLSLPQPFGSGDAYSVPRVSLSGGDGDDTGGGGSGDSTFEILTNYLGTFAEERSPYAEYITFEKGRADSSIENEYLIVRASASLPQRTVITGWRVESTATSLGAQIGNAAELLFTGSAASEVALAMNPGDTVYIVTGRSPIGASFRTNRCTGYFEQFQDFTPKLKLECPRAKEEAARVFGAAITDQCRAVVDDIDRCTLETDTTTADTQCRNFITETLTYNGCVAAHKNTPGFYGNEWYLYLKRDQELWKEEYERIRLVDENKKVVGAIRY